MKIEGKVAVITGASRGLGAGLALELARQGARVALIARNPGPLGEVADRIREKGGKALVIAADVSDKRAIYPISGQVAELLGPPEILINNASVLGPVPLRHLMDTDCEDLESTLAANLVGPFRLTKVLLGQSLLRDGLEPLVINISSDAAVQAYPGWGVYSASKAALDHLTRIWAVELEGTRAKLWAVDPGEMNTRMHEDAIPEADKSSLQDPNEVARLMVSMIRESGRIPSGARLTVSEWSKGHGTGKLAVG